MLARATNPCVNLIKLSTNFVPLLWCCLLVCLTPYLLLFSLIFHSPNGNCHGGCYTIAPPFRCCPYYFKAFVVLKIFFSYKVALNTIAEPGCPFLNPRLWYPSSTTLFISWISFIFFFRNTTCRLLQDYKLMIVFMVTISLTKRVNKFFGRSMNR